MKGYISGKALMKQWGISPHELLHRFIKKGLIAYNNKRQEVSPDEIIQGTDDQRRGREKIVAWSKYEDPLSDTVAQKMIHALDDLYFYEPNVRRIGKDFHLEGIKKAKSKRIHPDAMAKQKARAVAAELWAGKYKDLSVPELIETQEMLDATLKPDGITHYSARTVKDWIKDLSPNPPLKGAPRKAKK